MGAQQKYWQSAEQQKRTETCLYNFISVDLQQMQLQ